MLTSLRSVAFRHSTLIQRTFFGVALVYAVGGAMVDDFVAARRLSAVASWQLLLVTRLSPFAVHLVSCLTPLAIMLVFTETYADRISLADRRVILLLAAAPALILLLLVLLVPPCSGR